MKMAAFRLRLVVTVRLGFLVKVRAFHVGAGTCDCRCRHRRGPTHVGAAEDPEGQIENGSLTTNRCMYILVYSFVNIIVNLTFNTL